MAVERTFSIIKPDATARNLTGAINAMIEQAGLRIVAQKRVRITREQAETFYAVHRERPFFGELVDFMISGPVVVQVLEGENAIVRYRDIMGATDPAKAARGHHPQGARQVDRRKLGARFGRAGHGREGNCPVLLRQRDRRLGSCAACATQRGLVRSVTGSRLQRPTGRNRIGRSVLRLSDARSGVGDAAPNAYGIARD